ncbi:SDR family NAD(P)-dependent oxidoreductase [Algihabitans albus]|uniref:SDR family NAD(P)-dependent oxidoreductase n=1 Tax=Algihabitans albus TaxID=2164067 RepID=UPI000E5CBD85|nr:SDR family NAD(P)-dependent oxidoreductase [Algihabitans albus]
MTQDTAVVLGVGPGLGWHLCERFAAEGLRVIAAARSRDRVERLIAESGLTGIEAAACDAADATSVTALFEASGSARLVVYNAGKMVRGGALELSPAEVEAAWRVICLGGLHTAQAAIPGMLELGGGTLIYTGATASLRGGAGFAGFALSKFGLRALSQSLAREFGPQGIHVAHTVIDGQIASAGHEGRDPATLLAPEAIAEAYWQLHRQDRAAWSFEIDLRPAAERW